MKMDKKMVDKNIILTFTFNPEEYLKKDWQVMSEVNQIILNEVLKELKDIRKQIRTKVREFYNKNKEKIIEDAKIDLIQKITKRIEEVSDELDRDWY